MSGEGHVPIYPQQQPPPAYGPGYGAQPQPYGYPQPYAYPQPAATASGGYPQQQVATFNNQQQNSTNMAVHINLAPQPQAPQAPQTPLRAESNRATVVDNMEFSEKSIRHGFIRKVYAILALQLILTFSIACIFFFSETVKLWSQENPALVISAMILSIVFVIVLSCCPNIRRSSPQNFIFLFLFTACEGVLIGSVCSYYDSDDVLKAVVATILIVIGLTLFAFQTKIDFTMSYGLLITLTLGLIIFGVTGAIFQSDWMGAMYAALGAMLFSAYIVVDTQLIMGGKHKLSISPEEYVFASLSLYLDIINLFLMLLRIFGSD